MISPPPPQFLAICWPIIIIIVMIIMNMYAISTLLRCSKRSAMQTKTNKQTYNSKTDQSNASINKWDLRLVLKVSNLWPNLECVVLLWILQECIDINYYIKDLVNNAVCERAEAYQSTARSRIFLVVFVHKNLQSTDYKLHKFTSHFTCSKEIC